jgi:hypothetical protein
MNQEERDQKMESRWAARQTVFNNLDANQKDTYLSILTYELENSILDPDGVYGFIDAMKEGSDLYDAYKRSFRNNSDESNQQAENSKELHVLRIVSQFFPRNLNAIMTTTREDKKNRYKEMKQSAFDAETRRVKSSTKESTTKIKTRGGKNKKSKKRFNKKSKKKFTKKSKKKSKK